MSSLIDFNVRSRASVIHSSRGRTAGFALVVALGLMAFVLLLLLSMSSLLRVEMVSANINLERERARNNAMLGLMQGIGELQEMLGPDQRISATANIITEAGYSGQAAAADKRHWLGVWGSENYDPLSPQATQQADFKGWLISGEENEDFAEIAAPYSNYAEGTDAGEPLATLVGLGSVLAIDSDDSTREGVKAPMVEIPQERASRVGRFSWWIADESTKAKINLYDEQLAATDVAVRDRSFRFNQPARFGAEAISLRNEAGELTPLPFVFDQANINNISDLQDLAYYPEISSMETALKSRFHDATVASYGLLTDVRNGGFKRDLSAGFYDDSQFDDNFGFERRTPGAAKSYLFTELPGDSGTLYGPTWNLLKGYATQHRTLSADGEVPMRAPLNRDFTQLTRAGDARDPKWADKDRDELLYMTERTQTSYLRNMTYGEYGIHPLLTRLEMGYFVDSELVSGKYRLRLIRKIVATLANPYNVTLLPDDYTISWKMNPTFSFSIDDSVGGQSEDLTLELDTYVNNTYGRTTSVIDVPQLSFDPGEVKVISVEALLETSRVGNDPPVASGGYHSNGGSFIRLYQDSSEFPTPEYADGADELTITTTTPDIVSGDRVPLEVLFLHEERVQSFIHMQRLYPSHGNFEDEISANSVGPTRLDVLAVEPAFLWSVVIEMKTPDRAPPGKRIRPYANFNPRAHVFTNQYGNYFTEAPSFFIDFKDLSQPFGGNVVPGSTSGFWGPSSLAGGGRSEVALFDVPRVPLQSLGQLRHASLSLLDSDPLYVVGNSLAPINVGRDEAWNPATWDRSSSGAFAGDNNMDASLKKTTMDLAWGVNNALWDSYFFSSVPSATDGSKYFYDGQTFDQPYVDNGLPLPNSRYKFYGEPSVAELRDIDTAAASLIVDGPFNVNSTSVEAWKALLASLNRQSLRTVSGNESGLEDLLNPYARTQYPLDANFDDWNGPRELTDQELDDLAQDIVEQVELRGPFLNLSDFVNRRLVADATGVMGTLDAAIAMSTVNPAIDNNRKVEGNSDMTSQEHAQGGVDDFRPGYLTQGELLSAWAPCLTTRGDVFKIRAYGESGNSVTGELVSAWCEATVMRMPEFVDSTNGVTSDIASLTSTNQNFGRKFEIIKFRWLSKDEI